MTVRDMLLLTEKPPTDEEIHYMQIHNNAIRETADYLISLSSEKFMKGCDDHKDGDIGCIINGLMDKSMENVSELL